MIKLVIFDMDGIIFDSEKLYMHFLKIMMKRYHYILTKRQYISTLGLTDLATKIKMQELFGADFTFDKIYSQAKQEMMTYIEKKNIPLKDGILNLLNFLKSNNYKIAIASSTDKTTIFYYLQKSNLNHYFDYIVGDDDVINSKPHPEIFLKACDKINIDPSKALVLEDSPNGLLAAIRANITAICIPDLLFPPQEIASKCFAIVNSANEVIDILKKGIN